MAFSARYSQPFSKNLWTQRLEEKLRRGCPLVDLTLSNPTQAGLDYPVERIVQAFSGADWVRYEPVSSGLLAARGAVCRYYAERRISLSPDQVLLTSSTSEGYAYLFKLFCNPGDAVLVPRPSYPLLEFLGQAESVTVRPYLLRWEGSRGWRLDLDSLIQGIGPDTRGLIVVHPNNPTGSYLLPEEWARVVEIAQTHRLFLVCDEVFWDYPLECGRPLDPLEWTARIQPEAAVFFLNGLSKTAGLPHLKISWIVAAGSPEQRRESLGRLELIADTFLSVSTPVQQALPVLLEAGQMVREQIRRRVKENHQLLTARLRNTAVESLRIEGGWSSVLRLPRIRSEEDWVVHLLEEKDLVVHPGYFYDFENEAFVVISLLTPGPVMKDGIELLRAALERP